ncbi:hypothetical protein RFI_06253 [Reticulomyxa filosa]|uniref:Tubulin-tyrosine ligase family protein n=1 Tax=Reticulomyxa filosa TaxID=46433 RepID=X6NX50_RETFI|nr:hypothetical protein RFI_06253 [Reticulomyxa filosa]|eukprot:ETO30870.1 hypothetical protein RFI_06253 [Reticulomyxa filosa]
MKPTGNISKERSQYSIKTRHFFILGSEKKIPVIERDKHPGVASNPGKNKHQETSNAKQEPKTKVKQQYKLKQRYYFIFTNFVGLCLAEIAHMFQKRYDVLIFYTISLQKTKRVSDVFHRNHVQHVLNLFQYRKLILNLKDRPNLLTNTLFKELLLAIKAEKKFWSVFIFPKYLKSLAGKKPTSQRVREPILAENKAKQLPTDNEEKIADFLAVTRKRVAIASLKTQVEKRMNEAILISPNKKINFRKSLMTSQQRTFLTNRSLHLSRLLVQNGWVAQSPKSNIPCSVYGDKRGALSQMPRVVTQLLDNKKMLYLLLVNHNLQHYMPPTFLTLEDAMKYRKSSKKHATKAKEYTNEKENNALGINLKKNKEELMNEPKEEPETDPMWFLKKNGAACQKAVFSYLSLESMKEKYDEIEHPEQWVIQKSVQRPHLLDGRKAVLRLYVLVTHDIRIFLHRKGVWAVLSKPYDANDPDPSAQCDHKLLNYNPNVRLPFTADTITVNPQYHTMWKSCHRLCYETVTMVKSQLNPSQNVGVYHIFGYDIIFDCDLQPWLVEINHYPSLRASFDGTEYGKHGEIEQPSEDGIIKNEVVEDFYWLIIAPFFNPGTIPRPKGWFELTSSCLSE